MLARIVGRDTAALDEPEVLRATIETLAENLSDAVIAPLLYLGLGGPVGDGGLQGHQHARQHGRVSQRAIPRVRLGVGAARRRRQFHSRPAHGGAGVDVRGPAAVRLAALGGGHAARRAVAAESQLRVSGGRGRGRARGSPGRPELLPGGRQPQAVSRRRRAAAGSRRLRAGARCCCTARRC